MLKKLLITLPTLLFFSLTSCTDSSSNPTPMTLDQPFVGKYTITTMTTANVKDANNTITADPQKLFEGTIEFTANQSFTLDGTSYLKWPWQQQMTPQAVNEKGTLEFTDKDKVTFIGNAPEPGFTISGYYKISVFDEPKFAEEKRQSLPDNLQYTWLENKNAGIYILMIKTFFADEMGL